MHHKEQNLINQKEQIMVVDDDRRLHHLLTRFFNRHGYYVVSAKSSDEARSLLPLFQVDLMVLDVMMPKESGFEFASWLAPRYDFPILMLTAADQTEDKLKGLNLCDDYLTKPFEPEELLLRMKNLLKRSMGEAQSGTPMFHMGELIFDEYRQELLDKNGMPQHLTGAEKFVFSQLAQNVGQVVSRENLSHDGGQSRMLDVLITKLRKKIHDDPKTPRWIQTVRGQGYKFTPDHF